MHYLLKQSVSFVRVNIAHLLRLWHAQFEAWERLSTIPVHAATAWQAQTLDLRNAHDSSKSVTPLLRGNADPRIEELHGRWRDMYDASILYEAVSEIQPASAGLLKSRAADFDECLAAARTADQGLVNIASTRFGREGS
jgi:hypothetical protein